MVNTPGPTLAVEDGRSKNLMRPCGHLSNQAARAIVAALLNNQTSYEHSPVYTRFLTTSYKGQLLEINFTTNLTTEPELKEEIDRIMESVRLEE